MSSELRIVLLIGVVIYFIAILFLLRKKTLTLKYSLIWLFSSLVLFVMAVFPGIVTFFSDLFGIASEVNAIFLVFIFFILLILISLTSIVSKQHKQIKILIQTVSILKKETEELKTK